MMTFTINEVSLLVGIPVRVLRDWIDEGALIPVERGGRGAGNAHRFSPAQLIGLKHAGWIRYTSPGRRLGPEFVKRIMVVWQTMSDDDVRDALREGGRWRPFLALEDGKREGFERDCPELVALDERVRQAIIDKGYAN